MHLPWTYPQQRLEPLHQQQPSWLDSKSLAFVPVALVGSLGRLAFVVAAAVVAAAVVAKNLVAIVGRSKNWIVVAAAVDYGTRVGNLVVAAVAPVGIAGHTRPNCKNRPPEHRLLVHFDCRIPTS